jgi:GNAT superfamily N-acetyltransferase
MADLTELLAAYDAQMRGVGQNLAASVVVDRDGPLTRVSNQHRGFVTGPRDLGVEGAELDALIARQQAFFADVGLEWKTRAHDVPRDITGRLTAAGFVAEPHETVEIAAVADLGTDPRPPDGVVLRELTEARDLRRIGGLESAVWDADMAWIGEDLVGRVAAWPDRIVVFAAEADDELVSAAWLVFRPGTDFAGMLGGATLAPWRGRGIYRALVAARAARARARGVRYLQVDASDDSRPILERLGFVGVTETTPYVWMPETT